MKISKDLFLAILSMDSFNRGYDAGIDGLSDATDGTALIGNAKIWKNLEGQNLDDEAEAAGFYAISYKINAPIGNTGDQLATNQVIISYRGTDNNVSFWDDDPASDLWNGYGVAAGFPLGEQARLAVEFYQSVTETGNSDPREGSAILRITVTVY